VWGITGKLIQNNCYFHNSEKKLVLDDLVANRRIIKIDLREIGWECVDCIHLVQYGNKYRGFKTQHSTSGIKTFEELSGARRNCSS